NVHEIETHSFHRRNHRRWWRRACNHSVDTVTDTFLQLRGSVQQNVVHDGRATIMRDAVFPYQLENAGRIDLAQANVRSNKRRASPGKTPSVAMKHRQSPEIDSVLRYAPSQDFANCIDKCPTMRVNHTFGIPSRARGVVQSNGVPFV